MGLYRLPAIVLRTYPYADTHLIATLFSPTHGKLRALAKGCRRLQSNLGRVVSPMTYGVFQLAEGKNLDSITQGMVKSAFPQVRGDLGLLAHGLYALELVDRLMEEPEPQPQAFFLLLKTLEGLEAGTPSHGLLRAFEAHLLRLLGYKPELERCVQCGGGGLPFRFSARLGGVLCPGCQGRDQRSKTLNNGVLHALRLCFESPPGDDPGISVDRLGAVAGILQAFIEEKSGKMMHGYQFLELLDSSSS